MLREINFDRKSIRLVEGSREEGPFVEVTARIANFHRSQTGDRLAAGKVGIIKTFSNVRIQNIIHI